MDKIIEVIVVFIKGRYRRGVEYYARNWELIVGNANHRRECVNCKVVIEELSVISCPCIVSGSSRTGGMKSLGAGSFSAFICIQLAVFV